MITLVNKMRMRLRPLGVVDRIILYLMDWGTRWTMRLLRVKVYGSKEEEKKGAGTGG